MATFVESLYPIGPRHPAWVDSNPHSSQFSVTDPEEDTTYPSSKDRWREDLFSHEDDTIRARQKRVLASSSSSGSRAASEQSDEHEPQPGASNRSPRGDPESLASPRDAAVKRSLQSFASARERRDIPVLRIGLQLVSVLVGLTFGAMTAFPLAGPLGAGVAVAVWGLVIVLDHSLHGYSVFDVRFAALLVVAGVGAVGVAIAGVVS